MSIRRRSERVAVPKTAAIVADKIRSQLARGELKPGDRLPPEAELMVRFGIARPTMREAIRILESESLISTRRGAQNGARVHAVDASVLARRAGLLLQMNGATWEDLYEAQFVIEPRALRLAATRRTRADLAALEELVEQARQVVDVADFASIAAAFHVALVRASKNKTVTMIAEMLHDLTLELYRTRLIALRPIGEKVKASSVELYEAVIDRLEARDGAGAEKLWGKDRPALNAALERLHPADRSLAIYHS